MIEFKVRAAEACGREGLAALGGGRAYLGLAQRRSLWDTPPPQVLEHGDQGAQSDQWPWVGLGPSSPYLTHWPPRHH